jgi:tetratricopeptide (TPR) repeat protein
MKTLAKILFLLTTTVYSFAVSAQEPNDPKSLVKQGVTLNDDGKYAEAIAKYNEALRLDSTYESAYYEMAYTLFTSGKEKEAIPYLEKLLNINPNTAGAYDMLGSIYDDDNQSEKAIWYYSKGIKADPGYQRLHFNLAITYYKLSNYKESEKYAIEAIKLNPKHASSQRIYAMATYKLQKRACSLLSWCSFILLEPNTKRSTEAYNYIKAILTYGIKQTSDKSVNITVSPDNVSSVMMPISIISATEGKKGLSAIDSLQLQLTSIFEVSHTLTGDKENSFVSNYFSDYFAKLGISDNMPAFARLVSLSAYKDENVKWFKDNDDKLKALDSWIASTKREF